MFIINGNCGSHEQFPIIANSLEAYLNQLTDVQNASVSFESIYEELTGVKIDDKGSGRMHLGIDAYGFHVGAQPIALDSRMLLDQAYFIKQSILFVMKQKQSQPYTIIAHSVGCLIAMLIEDELRAELKSAPLVNIVCMAAPIAESPTLGLNRDLERVLDKIRAKHKNQLFLENSETLYTFFSGGLKDNMITESMHFDDFDVLNSVQLLYNHGLNFYRNAIYINTETDMRSVYGSLHHSSFFYQRQFMETFVVGIGKLMIASLRQE